MRRSIRWYLLLLVLAVLVPLVLLQGYTLWAEARADLREAGRGALRQAEVTAAQGQALLEDAQALLVALARRPGVREAQTGQCDPILKDLAALNPHYANTLVVDPAGNVMCSGVTPANGLPNLAALPWFQEALRAPGLAIGTPHVGLITGVWVSVQGLTLRDAQGRPERILGLPLKLTELRPALGLGPLASGRTVEIVNSNGVVIAREPDAADWVGRDVSDATLLQTVLKRERGHQRLVGPDGIERIYGFSPVGATGWFALAGVPTQEVLGPVQRHAITHALVAIAVTALAIVLALFSTRRIVLPVRAVGRAARRVAEGDLRVRVPVEGPYEIASVAERFNDMLGRRAEAQEAQVRLQRVLEAVRAVQESYIAEAVPEQVFQRLLSAVLELSGSRYGFVGEVLDDEQGRPYLQVQAISEDVRDEAAPATRGVPFERLDSLFATALTSGEPVIANDAAHDSRVQALPFPHPPLQSLLGLPLFWQGRLVGMAGLGNRPQGYDRALVAYLEPLLTTCANIIDAYRSEQRRRAAEQQLAYLAQYDALTGLPNRYLLRDRLRVSLQRAARTMQRVGVVVVNADRFKRINETLGRTAGDAYLQAVAERLTRCVSESDTVARLEGDEFAVVLDQVADVQSLADSVQRLQRELVQPLQLGEQHTTLTVSVGISVYPDDGAEAETLLQRAGLALAHARQQGGRAYSFYAPHLQAQAAARLALEARLRGALERGELVLHYQPQVELASGRITGVEALLRWQTGGQLLRPEEFVPLAEDSELIVPIGAWVLEAACAQVMRWQRLGLPALMLSVNVSPAQLKHGDVAEVVERALQQSGLPAQQLELEITENLLLEQPEEAVATLNRLRQAGVRLAIDDFGTGYSSLAYLKRLPVNKVKIDRSFVRDLNVDPEDEAIVTAIIALARALNLTVTAEGVETPEQDRLLKVLRCEQGQGYHYGRPVAPEAVQARFESRAAEHA